MFNFFKKNQPKADSSGSLASGDGKTNKASLLLKISGMHCNSCSMNIDGDLEDLDGVLSATTSYARQESKIEYDSSKVDQKAIKKVIEDLGYKVL
ncbi:heavy-metal-associated domain-containing protein [Candidatus Woesebacteria bacterium]|nr:heavy-metal-associated domain-containing protein [Candidatus Woesebacteria bacterium]